MRSRFPKLFQRTGPVWGWGIGVHLGGRRARPSDEGPSRHRVRPAGKMGWVERLRISSLYLYLFRGRGCEGHARGGEGAVHVGNRHAPGAGGVGQMHGSDGSARLERWVGSRGSGSPVSISIRGKGGGAGGTRRGSGRTHAEIRGTREVHRGSVWGDAALARPCTLLGGPQGYTGAGNRHGAIKRPALGRHRGPVGVVGEPAVPREISCPECPLGRPGSLNAYRPLAIEMSPLNFAPEGNFEAYIPVPGTGLNYRKGGSGPGTPRRVRPRGFEAVTALFLGAFFNNPTSVRTAPSPGRPRGAARRAYGEREGVAGTRRTKWVPHQ